MSISYDTSETEIVYLHTPNPGSWPGGNSGSGNADATSKPSSNIDTIVAMSSRSFSSSSSNICASSQNPPAFPSMVGAADVPSAWKPSPYITARTLRWVCPKPSSTSAVITFTPG